MTASPSLSGAHPTLVQLTIVLMAVVDADNPVIYCDVGATGCGSDGGVFAGTSLKCALESKTIGLPTDEPLQPGGGRPIPYYLLRDDAFHMLPWLLKPYPHRSMTPPERIFSYRLSRT